MVQPMGTQITCPNCRQPFQAMLEQIIDVGRDPQAKARLLAGRTNLVQCPHCGYQSALTTPLIYHDPLKSLLITFIPMELALPQQEQERLIGSLTNAIMRSLPQEQRKGYLLTPRMALSLQGLVEMILEADGVTKEMIDAQRAKMRLVETFLQTDPDQLPELVKEHDASLDTEFFTMMTATAESAMVSGRRDVAEHVLALRERLLELSTVGQDLIQKATTQEATMQQVADALNALGENATHDNFVDLTLELATDEDADEKLQVLVGLARPVMDYQFFQILTKRIDRAKGEHKEQLSAIRDRLLELTNMVDQQNETVIKQATDTLRAIINSPDLEEAIRSRIELLDDTFLAVLSANVQSAEQKKDVASAARLKQVFDTVVSILQESAPPAIRFINDLMQIQDVNEAKRALNERAQEFGPELIQWMDMLTQDLAARGNDMALERLSVLRQEAVQALAVAGMQSGPSADGDGRRLQLAQQAPQQAPRITPMPRAEEPAPDQQGSKSGIILPFSARKRSKKE